jgi:peptidoglycan hydrolase-like protein with peptidoglycan-binding domain
VIRGCDVSIGRGVGPSFDSARVVGLVDCSPALFAIHRASTTWRRRSHMRKLAITTLAIAILPGVLAAQTDSSRMRGRDTTRGRTEQSSSGSLGRRSRGNYGLTSDQISQLQTALQQSSCNPGAVDGVLGPRTRSAMACARRKNNITGNNPNDLFRSLNLNFTASDSTGMGGTMSSGRRGARSAGMDNRNNSTMGNDSSMAQRGNRGMGRTSPDSTTRRGTRRGSTRRPGTPPRPDSTRRP